MIEAKVCAHCGADIALDQPIMIDDFSMLGAGYPLLYRGEQVRITHNESLICWALMKSYPGYITVMGLIERLNCEGEDPENVVRVHICRIRRTLRKMGALQPIRTLAHHHAYVWDPHGCELSPGTDWRHPQGHRAHL